MAIFSPCLLQLKERLCSILAGYLRVDCRWLDQFACDADPANSHAPELWVPTVCVHMYQSRQCKYVDG